MRQCDVRTVEEVKRRPRRRRVHRNRAWSESPITGPEGNVEYLVRAVFRNKSEAI